MKQKRFMNIAADTMMINDRVNGNIQGINNVIVYGGVLGNISNCENVYIIGGSILGNVDNNGMVFGCDDSELTKKSQSIRNIYLPNHIKELMQ